MSARIEGYKKRKAEGMCYRCFARPAEPDQRRCWYCIDVQRDYNRRYMRSKYKRKSK